MIGWCILPICLLGQVPTSGGQAPQTEPLKLQTQAALPAAAVRIALGDFTGDGRDRLATLQGTAGAYTLHVYRWEKTAPKLEWRSAAPVQEALLAAGRFAQEGPVVLVTPAEWVQWNGSAYVEHRFPQSIEPVGMIAGRDGRDVLVVRTGPDFALMRIRPNARDADVLERVDGPGPVDTYRYGILHASPAALGAALPAELAAAGILGIGDLRGDGHVVRFALRTAAPSGEAVWNLVLLGAADGLTTGPKAAQEAWRSKDLPGVPGDVAVGELSGDGRLSLLVLAEAPGQDQRSLFLFSPASEADAKPAGQKPTPYLKANSPSARPQSFPKKPAARTPAQPRESISVDNTVKSGYSTPERK